MQHHPVVPQEQWLGCPQSAPAERKGIYSLA
jgi:hypothetical protein